MVVSSARQSVLEEEKQRMNRLSAFMKLLMNEVAEFLGMWDDYFDGVEFSRERELEILI